MNFSSNRLLMAIAFSLFLVNAARAEELKHYVMKCAKPSGLTEDLSDHDRRQLNVAELMSLGYHCEMVEIKEDDKSTLHPQSTETQASKVMSQANLSLAAKKYSADSTSYRACLDLLKVEKKGPMSAAEIRCFQMIAPETRRGQPLTPAHVELLKQNTSMTITESESPRGMFLESPFQPPVRTEEIPSCLKLREAAFLKLENSSEEGLRKFTEYARKNRKRSLRADQVERDRLNNNLNEYIYNMFNVVAKVQNCTLGARRSSLGQSQSSSERTRSRLAVKGSGTFDFGQELVAKAVEIAAEKKMQAGNAE